MPSSDSVLAQQLSTSYARLLAVCGELEDLADHLPRAIDTAVCLRLAEDLRAMLDDAHAFEERVVFPPLAALSSLQGEFAKTLARLRAEHQVDVCYAEEVAEMLRGYGSGRPNLSADAAGFMLRGFFQAIRRHVVFEQELLLPLLRLTNIRPSLS